MMITYVLVVGLVLCHLILICMAQYSSQSLFYFEADFITSVYPDDVLQNPIMNGIFFKNRAIVCARNSEVKSINEQITSMLYYCPKISVMFLKMIHSVAFLLHTYIHRIYQNYTLTD
ncbi:hypothetical protein BDB01DRAFT_873969 [Pilobolus umbonatus]|nr:hypothetical protein BDB01DRAFT_873969 [Pilobolus umbonatus]